MSSDGYRDLWRPFFTLFWRYWPDCPFPVYLGSNRATYNGSRVTTLLSGDYEWSKTLRVCLEQIESDYVLFLLEDYFLKEPVSSADVVAGLCSLHVLHGTVLRLYPHPGPDATLPDHGAIGRIHRLAPFRISTQSAIWKRSDLLNIARDNESIWDFELHGTHRSRSKPDGFYATYNAVLQYRHVVERGKWFRSAARLYARDEIGCDFSARPVISRFRTVIKFFNARRRNLIDALVRLSFRGRA